MLLLVAAAAAAALDAMGDATQTRPERVDLEARTRIELQVATKLHDGRPLRLAAESVWQACQWTVRRRLEAPGVRPIGGDRFELVVVPELGEQGRRRLRGCLQDAVIDRVRASVVSMRRLPAA